MIQATSDRSRVWVLVDERPGTAAQALGVADALGWACTEIPLCWSQQARLPNPILGPTLAGLAGPSKALIRPPWPDLVIAAGRRAALVARHIKRAGAGTPFLAQIMYPGRTGIGAFDLVAVPNHDGLARRRNFLPITGAPHRMNARTLARAADEWAPRLAHIARPWIGLVLGGATRRRGFSAARARELGGLSANLARDAGASLLVATSPRTGPALDPVLAGIEAKDARPALVHRWGEAENPYPGLLALAEGLVVTGDSVTMCSEACASAASVLIHAPEGFATAKHRRLHAELFAAGHARPLAPGCRIGREKRPTLNAAGEIAAAIRSRLGV